MEKMRTKISRGKVPWEKIAEHVRGKLPPEVLLGPAIGEDAALIRIGGEVWAVASDPITFTSKKAGKLAVIVNANDIAARGAKPLYFTAVVLVSPAQADEEAISGLLEEIRSTCEGLGVALIGGHTEVTPGLSHTVIAGTMLGKVVGRPITTGGLHEGDLVGMTKWAGLEGTGILLREFEQRLREIHGAALYEENRMMLDEDCLCVVEEALAAAACPFVTALHDVTEGGVGEGLYELAAASGLRIKIDPASIPILPVTNQLCSDFGMNPFGLIGSGSLLVGCAPEGRYELEKAFADRDIAFSRIGTAEKPADGPSSALPRFEKDEILRAWLLEGMEACVFDMDGTVVDAKYDWVAMRAAFGVGSGSIIEHLNSLKGDEKDSRLAELRQIERDASLAAHIKNGAAELLTLLREKGIKTALVTNNSEENASYLIEKFGLNFDLVITRDSGLYKPSGAPVAEAVKQLGATPEKTLCIGDSLYDVLACRAADCAWICMLYDEKNVYGTHVDLSFPTIEALIRYLRIVL
jgi:HAD superfamily hydrolase (TIGR01549 family)